MAQSFTTKPVEFKELIVETQYPLAVEKYEPPVELALREKLAFSQANDKPEAALVSHFAAMQQGNVEAFLSTWEPAAREGISRKMAARGLAASKSMWSQMLGAGHTVSLERRIKSGNYVLINYAIRNGRETLFTDTVAFKRVGGDWMLTQDLSNNPILMHWNEPTGRVKVPAPTLVTQ